MIKIQQVYQKIQAKQFLFYLFKLFSIGDSFTFKATKDATDLVTRQYHPTSCHIQSFHKSRMRTRNANANRKLESKRERDCRKTSVSQ